MVILITVTIFRPAYAQVGMLSALFPNEPTVALTATVTDKTGKIISNSQGWWILS